MKRKFANRTVALHIYAILHYMDNVFSNFESDSDSGINTMNLEIDQETSEVFCFDSQASTIVMEPIYDVSELNIQEQLPQPSTSASTEVHYFKQLFPAVIAQAENEFE